MRRKNVLLGAGALVLLSAAGAANAQAPTAVSEVQVTARTLEDTLPEQLAQTGVKVDVIPAQQIRNGGYVDVATDPAGPGARPVRPAQRTDRSTTWTCRCSARARPTCCGWSMACASTTASTPAPRRWTLCPRAWIAGWKCSMAASRCSTAPRRWPAR
ncbi:MAG: hypothetical protein WDN45_18780 [Caulobacteraceae bacterium]